MTLTSEDFDLILEALEAWKSRHMAGNFMGGVMTILTSSGESPDMLQAKMKKEFDQQQADRRVGAERAILLQAKLIQLRTQMTVDEITR